MKKIKILVNCSNHPNSQWSEEQKAGWDKIVDVPFPQVNPHWDTNDKDFLKILDELRIAIHNAFENARPAGVDADEYLMLQGEFSVCYSLFKERLTTFRGVKFVIPTTERVTHEEVLPDGTVKKIQNFKFVRWRLI
jgi:hypothetical protein